MNQLILNCIFIHACKKDWGRKKTKTEKWFRLRLRCRVKCATPRGWTMWKILHFRVRAQIKCGALMFFCTRVLSLSAPPKQKLFHVKLRLIFALSLVLFYIFLFSGRSRWRTSWSSTKQTSLQTKRSFRATKHASGQWKNSKFGVKQLF